MRPHVIHLLSSFLLAVSLIPLLKGIALRIGLADLPNGRKIHEGAIPLTGGIAMFAAFTLPATSLSSLPGRHWALLCGLSFIVAVGVLDDLFDLRPRTKLVAQISAALIMILPEPSLIASGGSIEEPASQLFATAVTIVLVVGIINSFNMIDGLDGLAGGAALSALAWLAVFAWLAGQTKWLLHILLLLLAVLGFLIFNMHHPWRRHAAVFMGDAGSMMLGAAIAFFIVELAMREPETAAPLPVLLWMVALPCFDTSALIARRIAEGRSPFLADRQHVHHLMLEAGFSPLLATGILVAICTVLGGIGMAGWSLGIPDGVMLFGLAIPFTVHLYFTCYRWKRIEPRGTTAARTATPQPMPLGARRIGQRETSAQPHASA
jgi:UDP-GlcNAc:undecaprenyl-phosphate/decaprenyl-phosphate GlcNAc-1-phosphate transferase